VKNSCRQEFREIREQAGITCERCNSSDHYWLNSKQIWQCKLCLFRTSLRSGTIMESSKLPFHYWFIAIWFMGCNKKGTSARNVQRHLNHNCYEPIWAMMHKIRSAMGNRDNQYLLTGTVEVDEGFLETIVKQEQKEEPRKRGRGSQKQTMAMVFAQTEEVQKPKRHRPSKRCKYFKMSVYNDFTVETAKNIITKHIAKNTKMITDGYSTYKSLAKEFKNMDVEKTPSKQAHIKLPWVHTAIGNAKKVLQEIHQHIKPEYLQNYLDEFCYKLNRRCFDYGIFDRVLVACTLSIKGGK
jgi:hypothetical protein